MGSSKSGGLLVKMMTSTLKFSGGSSCARSKSKPLPDVNYMALSISLNDVSVREVHGKLSLAFLSSLARKFLTFASIRSY